MYVCVYIHDTIYIYNQLLKLDYISITFFKQIAALFETVLFFVL